MSRLHRLSAVAPTISVLLLLAALASAAAAADAPVKKVGIRFVRPANKEEAQWMDRYTGSDQQLGDGPIRMRRATAEDAKWLDRMSGNAGRAGDQSAGGGGSSGGDSYIEFDDDNPYVSCESICSFNCWCSHILRI